MDRLVRNPVIVRFTQAETPNNYNQNIKWGIQKFKDQHIRYYYNILSQINNR